MKCDSWATLAEIPIDTRVRTRSQRKEEEEEDVRACTCLCAAPTGKCPTLGKKGEGSVCVWIGKTGRDGRVEALSLFWGLGVDEFCIWRFGRVESFEWVFFCVFLNVGLEKNHMFQRSYYYMIVYWIFNIVNIYSSRRNFIKIYLCFHCCFQKKIISDR